MSRQRFIHPDFWTDPSLGKLTPEERLLFIGCFSNADDEGRLLGNPAYLRSTIFPYDDYTIQQIKDMRNHILEICKNIVLYEVDGFEYLAFIKWKTYQKPKYPSPSKFPKPPNVEEETFPEDWGNDSEEVEEDSVPRLGMGRDGIGMGIDRDGEQLPSDVTETEKEALGELRQVKGYPYNYQIDLELFRTLSVEFPKIDVLQVIKKWRTGKLDKPLGKKSNPRLQIRNWVEKQEQWRKESANGTNGSPNRGYPGNVQGQAPKSSSQYSEYDRMAGG